MTDTPQYTTTLTLPEGGKTSWTQIMQGQADPAAPKDLDAGSPIVMATAVFADGTRIAAGVCKGDNPTEFNPKFVWVFDANGHQYAGWPIDVSDHEDFMHDSYAFSLTECVESEYLLTVVEASA